MSTATAQADKNIQPFGLSVRVEDELNVIGIMKQVTDVNKELKNESTFDKEEELKKLNGDYEAYVRLGLEMPDDEHDEYTAIVKEREAFTKAKETRKVFVEKAGTQHGALQEQIKRIRAAVIYRNVFDDEDLDEDIDRMSRVFVKGGQKFVEVYKEKK